MALTNEEAQSTESGPIRVLYVDHTAKMGGGEIALFNLVTNLDRSRYEPVVLLGDDGDLYVRLTAAGVETHVLSLHRQILETRKGSLGVKSLLRPRVAINMLRYIGQIRAFIRQNRIGIVHTNSLKSDILGGVAGRLAGLPVIWHVRDRIADDYLPRGAARVFRGLCRVVPNFVIANSAATLETLALDRSKSTGVVYSSPRGRRVVHDGLSPTGPLHVFPPEGAPASSPRIGLVGRITPWKGQHVFIRAAKHVSESFPGAKFLIVGSAMFGEEAYEEEMRRLVAECGLEQTFEFMGFRPDVDAVIASLDVLVHASTVAEPFGQVVVEGMAAGTPVVATRGGGVIEIIEDGVTGTLVTMGSESEMAAAITGLLRDRARAMRIAIAARKAVAERFTIEKAVEKVQAVYGELGGRSAMPAGRLLAER